MYINNTLYEFRTQSSLSGISFYLSFSSGCSRWRSFVNPDSQNTRWFTCQFPFESSESFGTTTSSNSMSSWKTLMSCGWLMHVTSNMLSIFILLAFYFLAWGMVWWEIFFLKFSGASSIGAKLYILNFAKKLVELRAHVWFLISKTVEFLELEIRLLRLLKWNFLMKIWICRRYLEEFAMEG